MRTIFKRIAAGIALVIVVGAIACLALLLYQGKQAPMKNSYYVALGSSYAAGLGLGPRASGSPLVCQRSTEGYPQQLARLLKFSSFTDMSCSGATIRHVLHGGQVFLGPQIDALGPDTQLVTLTGGGNDVSYVGDLVMLSYRDRGGLLEAILNRVWSGPKPIAARPFDALRADFEETLREIHRRSPQAKIVVINYPSAVPQQGTCPPLVISAEEAQSVRAVGAKLAELTHEVSAATDAIFIDMAAASKGHDACSAQPWVNGASPAGAAFHPSPAGAQAIAQIVVEALR